MTASASTAVPWPAWCRSALSPGSPGTVRPRAPVGPGSCSTTLGGAVAGGASTEDTRVPSPCHATRPPPRATAPQQPSALRSREAAHCVTFSSCSLVSSSIFLRYMAPLTVSSLEGRGALGTGGPTAARGAAVSSGRGCTQDRGGPACCHLSSTADFSSGGVGARWANTRCGQETRTLQSYASETAWGCWLAQEGFLVSSGTDY